MKYRPILFSAPMVRAILDGRKTETRRTMTAEECRFGLPGDGLYVKETRWRNGGYVATDPPTIQNEGKIPAIFMARSQSRIRLRILSLHYERLQEITEAGALAEGVGSREEFIALWQAINGKKYPWERNPFVWVIKFRLKWSNL